MIKWSLLLVVSANGTTPAEPAAVAERQVGSTGEQVFTGPQIQEMKGAPPKLRDVPKGPDVEDLYRRGIQGEMVSSGYVGADGRMHDVVVTQSSRSPELDAIGRGLVNASTFTPGTDASGKPVAVRVRYPVSFWKDTFGRDDILKKPCSQFVIDADWFARTFPENKSEKYRGWSLANGMMFMSRMRSKSSAPSPTFAAVYAECQAHPERRFWDVLAAR